MTRSIIKMADGSDYTANTNFIYNNTMYGNGFGAVTDNSRSFYRNNIGFQNQVLARGAEFEANGAGAASKEENNLWGVDPLFVNAAARDFRLRPGSTAIDKGLTLSQVPNDYAGAQRPEASSGRYDIGAFEYGGVPSSSRKPAAPSSLRVQ